MVVIRAEWRLWVLTLRLGGSTGRVPLIWVVSKRLTCWSGTWVYFWLEKQKA